jgi:hypothetical protein
MRAGAGESASATATAKKGGSRWVGAWIYLKVSKSHSKHQEFDILYCFIDYLQLQLLYSVKVQTSPGEILLKLVRSGRGAC